MHIDPMDWYIDTGASMYMTPRKHWLRTLLGQQLVDEIVIGNKSIISVDCCGEKQITTVVKDMIYRLQELYVPSLATN